MNGSKFWLMLISGVWVVSCGATDIAREADFADRIIKTLSIGEAVWLEVDGRKFLSLYTETEYPDIKEAAIILHDKDAHPDRKPLIHGLRTELPKHRWSTLALQMPIREAGAESEDYFAMFTDATSRIRAAVRFLESKDYENIVIVGHGLGALMALQAQSDLQGDVKALAMIGVSVPAARHKAAQTTAFIKQTQMPLLDLFSSRDIPEVTDSAAKRRLAAKDNKDYRQVSIDDDDTMIVKRLYSWLRHAMEAHTSVENGKEVVEKEPTKNEVGALDN